jgi:hypothetical protein
MLDKEKDQFCEEPKSPDTGGMSRRDFLKMAGATGAVLTVGGGLGGVLASCGDDTATTTTAAGGATTTAAGGATTTAAGGETTTSVAAGAADKFRFASTVSLKTANGLEIQKWLNLFAKLKNQAGGWEIGGKRYEVVPEVYDCGIEDTTQTRSATEKAVLQDGHKFIICTWVSVPSVQVTVTEPNKVLWMGTDFAPSTLNPEFKYVVRGQALSFALGAPYVLAKNAMAKGAKTSLIVDNESQMADVGNAQWRSTVAAAGLETLDPLTFPIDTTDFGPIATKILSLAPDYVEMAYMSSTDMLVNLTRALADVGYDGLVMPGNIDPTVVKNMVAQVGADYIEGWQSMSYDPRGIQTDPTMLGYIDAYMKEYGELQQEGIFWIGPWWLFEDAVNNAQSTDVDVITQYLKSSKKGVRTLCGFTQLFARPDVGILDTIDSAPGHYLCEIQNGEMIPINTVSVKDNYLASIKGLGLVEQFRAYWDEYGEPVFPDEESVFDFTDL